LIAASLLTQSFSRLVAQDVGFRADGVVQFDLSLPVCGTIWAPDTTCAHSAGANYKSGVQVQRFTHELLGALRSMPGTVSAAAGFGVPFSATSKQQDDIVIKGLPAPPKERPNVVEHKYVTPGYFATLGIPLIKGRDFNNTDVIVTDTLTPRTVIVSEGAVKAYFGGVDPIGKVLVEQGTVIGVVGDTKTQALGSEPEPAVYNSLDQQPIGWFTVLIRSTSDAGSVISGARARVAAIDRTLPLDHIGELKTAVDASASSTRLAATVLGAFAFAALLLAVLGVYGLVSYSVRARRRELGIRLALGAPRGGLVSLIVRGGLIFVSAGVIVGLVLSIVAGGVVRGLVFGVSVNDPTTYAGAVGALFAIAAIASWIPARRASQVDPLITMRSD
jgi:predicted permease